ncbi:MAG TPA: ribose 5-phosphate isomerase B [Bacteriovoracaceae bacterium]|nr:ribose 5-phosphate isomerase B [Bacteriovoracaceae bacterium]
MKIFIASDHAAFNEKQMLVEHLKKQYEVIDLGTNSLDSTNYPEWVFKLVQEVKKNNTPGILLCGSGIGVCMAANRFKGIRAALCRDEEDARMTRLHNDANVLCLSGRKTPMEQIKKISEVFLTSPFEGGRHKSRIDQFNQLGE